MSSTLFSPVGAAFRAAAESFVPEIAAASPERWETLERIVEDALLERPLALRRQVLLLVRVLDLLCVARYRRRLASLDVATRGAFLERLGDSRILLLRRGIWGLRTLVMMGWYGQPAVQADIGYHASPRGWLARR
jgi:hypothetical protein